MKVKLLALALESLDQLDGSSLQAPRLAPCSHSCQRKEVSDWIHRTLPLSTQFSTVPLYPSEADRYHSEEALGLLV